MSYDDLLGDLDWARKLYEDAGVDGVEGARQITEAAQAIRDLQAQNAKLREAVDADLSDRMVAAGMVPLDAMTKPNCLTKFAVHAGMTDLNFFGEWLERKANEYCRMQAAHQTGINVLNDDLFDFVLGKAGAFKEALENFRAALEDTP